MNTIDRREQIFLGGYGSWLWTADGKRYLDFHTDNGTACLGYGSSQKDLFVSKLGRIPTHALNLYSFEERDKAAQGLCDATGMDKVFFCNSGAEAVEAALKLARKYQDKRHGRFEIWSHRNGFHGRTYGSMAATDGPMYYREGFGPHLQGFHHFDKIEGIPDHAAMVLLSPINGFNDVVLYPDGWLEELREYTAKREILLCFDEVQTGSGRCGAWSYGRKIGVVPDIACLAKGLAMGIPAGACLARAEVAAAFTPGTHYSTCGGNPFAMAGINAMLEWLTPARLEEINHKGQYLRQKLEARSWAGDVRGEGLMIAFDADLDARLFATKAAERGLIIGAFRPSPIKLMPPLNVYLRELDTALEIMDAVYRGMR